MEGKYEKPELLAPAGSPEALYAAIEAGADAVYLGGRIGNARMGAKNFSADDIVKGIKTAHFYGKKIFITLNTLYTNREILQKTSSGAENSNILHFVDFVISAGADALIVQDSGLASLIRKHIPAAVLHASTQAAGYNAHGAAVLKHLGFSRMVAARELSREDLKRLIYESEIEIEMFIHGALCASYSGRCYMSAAIGARSANKGSCAQPCRLQYNGCYPLSLKDLSLAPVFKDVLDLRPKSLKIEGRMKSAGYVYGVTKIYRRLIDEYRNSNAAENKELEALFSRQGFTAGYFLNKLGKSMYGIRTEENISNSKIFSKSFSSKDENITSVEEIKIKDHFKGATLNEGKTKRRFFKYRLKFNDVKLFRELLPFIYKNNISDNTEYIFLPSYAFDSISGFADSIRSKIGLIAPPVIKDGETANIKEIINKYKIKNILIDNIGDINLYRNIGGEINLHLDYGFNITNNFTLDTLRAFKISSATLSFELNFAQIRDISAKAGEEDNIGIYAYGRTPLMLMENCLIFNFGKCSGNKNNGGNCPEFALRDRKGEYFPVIPAGNHRNYIFNSVPAYLADMKKEIGSLNLSFAALSFTTENRTEAEKILRDYYFRESDFKKEPSEYPKKFTRLYK